MTGNVNARARLRINCVAVMDILLNEMAGSNIVGHFQVSKINFYVEIG